MGDDWNKEELKAAVEAYIEMLQKERTKQPYTKKRYYEALANKYHRSEKAFEYRMQNISYVLSLMGREWISGLKPAKNVGSNVGAVIEELYTQAEGKKAAPVAAFEIVAREEAKKKQLTKPTGNSAPRTTSSEVTQYQRDATVKAWVLQQADGKCENCGKPAPFTGADGTPYLEVHHVRQLADNGPDTITNAVALCPNCHKEFHYGANAREIANSLYERVDRLILPQDVMPIES